MTNVCISCENIEIKGYRECVNQKYLSKKYTQLTVVSQNGIIYNESISANVCLIASH